MDESQLIFSICFASAILIFLIGFLLFVLLWQRRKSNTFLKEKELMQTIFNEQLLKAQLEIQEQTFNTISREIHDNIGQILSLAKVQLNIIVQSESIDKNLIEEIKNNVSTAMTDLRDIAKSLNSEHIQFSSLSDIAAHEIERINRSTIFCATLRSEGLEQHLHEKKKLIIFRIIQEALQNIIKHSKAKNIEVCFRYESKFLHIQIADDGTGFDIEVVTSTKGGLGLKNILKRASLINGKATIDSTKNSGTIITIISPYV